MRLYLVAGNDPDAMLDKAMDLLDEETENIFKTVEEIAKLEGDQGEGEVMIVETEDEDGNEEVVTLTDPEKINEVFTDLDMEDMEEVSETDELMELIGEALASDADTECDDEDGNSDDGDDE